VTVIPFHLLTVSAAAEIRMLARPTLTKRTDQNDDQKPAGQARPTEERFLLRVDGQTKRSFSSKEVAATAGAAVKKAYPIVMVTIVDTKDGTIEVIKA
jgi:hypothetical protein